MSLQNTKKHSKKPIAILICLLLLVIAVCIGYVVWSKNEQKDSDSVQTRQQQKESERKSNTNDKKDFVDSSQTGNTQNGVDTGITDPAQPASVSLYFSATQEGQTIITRTKITNTPSGKCTLTVRNGSVTTSQTADILYQPEFSSCAGFSIPKTTLGSGMWQLILLVSTPNGNTSGKAALNVT